MKIQRFEDILVWQKARELTVEIYSIFSKSIDFGFTNQIQRASLSIMNNIAEGFERRTNNELRQFLYISKGSSGEVRSMLYLASDLHKINKPKFDSLFRKSEEISKCYQDS